MKKVHAVQTIVLGLLLLAAGSTEASWKLLQFNPGDKSTVIDISMPTERAACAVGAVDDGQGNSAPYIAATSDGGQTWSKSTLPGTMNIPLSVHLVDGQIGYLTSLFLEGIIPKNKIYRTSDGGKSWTDLATVDGTNGLFTDIFFVDQNTGWTVGGTAAYFTSDGGAHWNQATLPALGDQRVVNGMFFLDALHGFAVGGNPGQQADPNTGQQAIPPSDGFILRSDDGGHSWQLVQEHTDGALNRTWFTDSMRGWAVGGGTVGLILQTSDGGVGWTPQTVPSGTGGRPDYVYDVAFVDSQTGYAVADIGEGNPMVLITADGGTNWTVDASYDQDLKSLTGMEAFARYSVLVTASFPKAGRGMMGGKNGVVVGLTGTGFCPDNDGDGHTDKSCGGDDCDDNNPDIHPGVKELCNGRDDDCDGVIDNGIDFQHDPKNCGSCGFGCQPAQVCWNAKCVLKCPDNLTKCGQTCVDVTTDPKNCGGCGNACAYTHAAATCQGSACQMGVCEAGWVDLDKDPANGCEYQCTPTGPEVCDGIDNNCDGQIDEGLTNCHAKPDGGSKDGSDGGSQGADGGNPGSGGGCSCATGPEGLGWVLIAGLAWLLRRRFQE